MAIAAFFLPLIPIIPILAPTLFQNTRNKTEIVWEIFVLRDFDSFSVKKSSCSNPYQAVVAYKPPSPKQAIVRRFGISNTLNRIKWFYEAPVIRFYNNLVRLSLENFNIYDRS